MSALIDFKGLQEDVAAALVNRDELAAVNVVLYRQFLLSSEVDLFGCLTRPRAGRTGTALVVEMPRVSVRHPNLPGPEFYLALPVVAMCAPTIAFQSTSGTHLSAEDAAQLAGDTLHGLRPRHQSGYQVAAEDDFMAPARDVGTGDFDIPRGVLAYRVTHELRMARTQTARCECPSLSVVGGVATLTNGAGTPTATIYYTLDGNYPCQFPTAGVASVQYSGPFAVASGDVVRWAAYQQGGADYQASFVGYYLVP